MKKFFLIALCFLFMFGCTMAMDQEILEKNDIEYTLESYDKFKELWYYYPYNRPADQVAEEEGRVTGCFILSALFGFISYGIGFLSMPFCFSMLPIDDYKTLAEPNAINCLYFESKSDECIIYRRTHKKEDSKVYFFDYKRLIPEDANIKTDEDFLDLVRTYHKYKEQQNSCYATPAEEETSVEKETRVSACLEKYGNISERLNTYIYHGGKEAEQRAQQERYQAQQRKKAEQKAKREREKAERKRKEAEEKRIAEAKRQAEIADCKQAQQKVDDIKNKIKQEYGDEPTICIGYVIGFGQKNEGLHIATQLREEEEFVWDPLIGYHWVHYKPEYFFLYTNNTNYPGQAHISTVCVRKGYYRYGSLTPQRAYQEVKGYTREDINIETYLNDKKLNCSSLLMK